MSTRESRKALPGKRLITAVGAVFLSFTGTALAATVSNDGLWTDVKESAINASAVRHIVPKSHRPVALDKALMVQLLGQAPLEFSDAARTGPTMITLPMPNGTFARFRVEESPVMARRLAAMHPEIKTYRGQGLDDPTATTRFDLTPSGFHAIVLSTQGTVIVEPVAQGRAGQYVSYDLRDAPKSEGSFGCLRSDAPKSLAEPQSQPMLFSGSAPLATTGTKLRTYRLALAATAEYTQTYGGGTVDGALSAMTTTINAVNAIYERDLTIRLVLVDNETSIIFTNPATDGYTSDNATTLLTQNQTVLDQRIGAANYDIGFVFDGHVYAYKPGFFLFEGKGQFQSVCANGQKGKGVLILRSIGPSTISAIYGAAHEMGHQFGALHTFNGTTEDCGPSRFAENAYEPGSGSTIMGYRGATQPNGNYVPICSFEDLHSTDTYFHAATIEQIFNYTTFSTGSSCPVVTDTGNNPPAVEAGPDYTIPANTPFTLTATASDPEADALTYCWEEYDLGAAGPPHTDNGNRPVFRSFAPVPGPARTLPQLSDILSGTTTFGESLPVTTRTMTFRVTVRDNHSGGGGVNTAAMRVNVRSDSGPFAVTQPASTTWTAGSNQTVTWNVANTSGTPINCENVRVLLSVDGGNSFPYILASSTPNSGSATISVPNTPTQTARVKVEAIGNIFFDISEASFKITSTTDAPGAVANVSTRLPVGTGENVLIEGFIVQGPAGSTKKIIVRALGPALAAFGITDALANPTLDIFDASTTKIASNNDWKTTQSGGLITGDQTAEITASQVAPSNDLESAIIADLAPGSYTALVRGDGNTVGTALVDAYDLSPASPARLANIATRGLVQPNDKLMIAGLTIQDGSVQAVVRAVGPSLQTFGITNALPDTTLQVRDQNGAIVGENDDWKTAQRTELESSGLQPSNDLEAALILTLPSGQYTAQVRGKPEATGIGAVEVYFLQ